jgi:hypothetical protein
MLVRDMDDMLDVYSETTRSKLYNTVNLLDRSDQLYNHEKIKRTDKVSNFNRRALYMSQNAILNDISVPQPSLIAKEFTNMEIVNFKLDIEKFVQKYFTVELATTHIDWLNNNYYFPRGIYYADKLVEAYQLYGINKGQWSDKAEYMFLKGIEVHLNEINYKFYNECLPLKDGYYNWQKSNEEELWQEMLNLHPYLEVVDQRKKSGFPHYQTQNVENITKTANKFTTVLEEDSTYVITVYFRTQGGKWVLEGIYKIPKWKIRFVGGTTLPLKMCGSPTTYVYKKSMPKGTPYFKDSNIVMENVLDVFKKNFNQPDRISFTTDISLNDQSHTAKLLDPVHYLNLKKMDIIDDPNVKAGMKKYTRACYKSMENPKVVWNVRQTQVSNGKERIVKSMSGNPLVPLYQTTTVTAAHLAAIGEILTPDIPNDDKISELYKNNVDLITCQIDDLFYSGDRIDIDIMGKYITKEFGLGINADKVETSDKNYITLLKVDVGQIYNEKNIEDIQLMDSSDPYFSFLGGISTKFKGFFDKERGNRDDGAPLFYIDPENLDDNEVSELLDNKPQSVVYIEGKKVVAVRKDLQQLLGVIMSFSHKLPLVLLELMEQHFKDKKVWDRLLTLSKVMRSIIIKEKDFGFSSYELLLLKISEMF